MRPFKVEYNIEIPANVEVSFKDNYIYIKGPKGESKKIIRNPNLSIEIKDNNIIIKAFFPTKRELRDINTLKSLIENMIKGVLEGYTYKLKAVYVHFPMKLKVDGNKLIIENFLGEKAPRIVELPNDVSIKVQGEEIILEGHDKELVGNAAGLIEQATRVIGKDRRKFQDGIYIIEKPE